MSGAEELAAHGPWPLGRAALVEWWGGTRAARDELPWRSERDPWKVLVAETMLAQTQASRVAGRYREVVGALATPELTARRSVAELIELWSGLGYYRRAISLRSCAQAVIERHEGVMPRSLGELLALPGVGPYTARAVLAFALDWEVGVLDTNIARVLARAVNGAPLTRGAAQDLADSLVPSGQSREWNLALMDFGALVCQASRPRCDGCPVRAAGACAWRSAGSAEDPARRSAATARPQARFEGSDRQLRGRLLKAALGGAIPCSLIAAAAGCDDATRTAAVIGQLVSEGLLEEHFDGSVELPRGGERVSC